MTAVTRVRDRYHKQVGAARFGFIHAPCLRGNKSGAGSRIQEPAPKAGWSN